jgi:hypothetical protein
MSAIHWRGTALVALVVGLAFGPAAAENVDPDNDGSQYAWTENAGWLNAQPSGVGGPGINVSDFDVQGFMWAENTGWISLSCDNTASCGTAAYGVKNDGAGHLSGLAWGENVGWIRFAHAEGGVGIDPATGEFSGYAWSENLGWISFSCANTGTCASSGFGVKTGWCQSTPASPTGGPSLRATRVGGDVELSQLTLGGGAAWHEIVRGSLSTLRSTGGNFAAATLDCAGDNVTKPTILVAGSPEPAPGDGYWYLARPANCKGKGTFDSGASSQSGSRDAEIAAAAVNCP